jgi:GrpB-like predicted nucleotidyltransferase (UPF0157 family)
MSDQPVEIAPYDAAWPERFEEQRAQVERILAPWLVGAVEHVGSTSVPGLAAKPVVDMLAGVRALDESRPCIDLLSADGWLWAPYREDVEHWFCRPTPEHRTHHLHVVEHGGELWNDMLDFRDALRADGPLRDRYGALKLDLATQHRHDRNAYTDAKSAFVEAALATARQGR